MVTTYLVGRVALAQLIVLGVIHTLTEVLPIGARAQIALIDARFPLLIAPQLAQGLGLGLRIGLLLATMVYFGRDLLDIGRGLVRMAKGKRDPMARLAFQLVVATVPIVVTVVAANRFLGGDWKSFQLTAWATAGAGALLLLADRACMTVKRIEHASYADAFVLGLAQALSVIPGVGRTVIVVAIARGLGYERQDAARFTFLIAIPALAASVAWNLLHPAASAFPIHAVLLGVLIAFVVGLAALSVLMNWLRRQAYTPFALYRFAVGVALVGFAYGWI